MTLAPRLIGEKQSLGSEVGTGSSEANPGPLWWLDHAGSAQTCSCSSSKINVDLALSLLLGHAGFRPLRKPTKLRPGRHDSRLAVPIWTPGLVGSDTDCWDPESLDNLQ